MSAIITVENLGKKYLLSHQAQRQPYVALRDVITEQAYAIGRKMLRPFRSSNLAPHTSLEDFWALKGVSLEIKQGEKVGIIGRNGAGKSTLLKILSRITEPSTGSVHIKGRVASLLEVGTGFHPELTGRENIFLNGAILGMSRAEIKKKFDEIVDFAEIEKFLDTPVKRYSSGMYVRLAFAVAAHLEPEILLVDEVLAVGDAQFQKKCLGKMEDVSTKDGRTVLFVSHNMQAVRHLCNRVLVLERGGIAYDGLPAAAVVRYFDGFRDDCAPADGKGRPVMEHGGEISMVKFVDTSGLPLRSCTRGASINVQVNCRFAEKVNAPEISMAVLHGEGAPVFSSSILDEYEPYGLEAGLYVFTFSFSSEYFKLEPYALTLYLLDGNKVLDHVDGVPLPEISYTKNNAFVEAHRWGIMVVPVKWELARRLK